MKIDFLKWIKNSWLDAAMVALFMLISFAYFYEPVSQGLVLGGHDTDAGILQGREQQEYRLAHDGETTRWTGAMFSGMPTYQIAPSYDATDALGQISRIYGLGQTGVVLYVLAYLLGFYIMMRAFNFKPYLAALGAVVWAFSSYFFIIIAAGHIWKVMTLAYIPPTIAGIVLCYRGKLVWGAAVTALFTAFQVLSNHVQMTYYFLFVMGLIVVAYGIQALRRKDAPDDALTTNGLSLKRWLKATAVIVVAGMMGVVANLPNLYHTYTYAKHTMRGGSELSAGKAEQTATMGGEEAAAGGLDYDYITQWSYGVDETMTLLIPNFKGGGTGQAVTQENVYDEPQSSLYNYMGMAQQAAAEYEAEHPGGNNPVKTLPGANLYWGNQPFTVGPVYVGAFVCLLFILGLFIVRGPMKWALAGATLISLLFAWGHNNPWLTHFFVDHLPMYNKFRTVSSALVIAEFTMPLLAMLALVKALRMRGELLRSRRGQIGLGVAATLTAGVCMVLWIVPSAAGSVLSADEASTMNYLASVYPDFASEYGSLIEGIRHGVISASAGRSLLVILLCAIPVVVAMFVKKMPSWAVCAGVGVVCLAEMWAVNKQYLNTDNFSDPYVRAETFGAKTYADEQILKDESYYRVLDLHVSSFNDNTASYWHHNIGGYHAAKLQRYQDVIGRCLRKEIGRLGNALQVKEGEEMPMVAGGDSICPVLNMLNMKYLILSNNQTGTMAAVNPAANGAGWFVEKIDFVKGADAEMAALERLDTKHAAVADEQFRTQLDGSPLGAGEVVHTSYEANELHYDIRSDKGGLVVFSEIYYPGWTATIDGQPAELGRVNYVLRALKVPAGNHKVVMTFKPSSVNTTNTIAFVALGLIVALFVGGLGLAIKKSKRIKD
ncbi:MAG: YfhO family protein [Alloprevotella sp.]